MNEKYEWALQQFGDEADTMSQSDIDTAYNKAHGIGTADAISNQPLKLTIPERVGQVKQKLADGLSNLSNQQEKNAAVANDVSFASPDVKQEVFAPQNEKERIAGEAYVNANAADIAEGTGFDKTNIVKDATAGELENDESKVASAEDRTNKVLNSQETSASLPKDLSKSAIADAIDGKYTNDPDKQYLVLNAITTALKNAGLSLNNVAAVMTGGTPSNDYATTEYEKRMSQRAQAQTESDILKEIPNSEEGIKLRAAQISNLNAEEQRDLAKTILAKFYDKNGQFIGDANSAEFKNLVTLANQVRHGGGAKDSLLSQLFARFAEFTGF